MKETKEREKKEKRRQTEKKVTCRGKKGRKEGRKEGWKVKRVEKEGGILKEKKKDIERRIVMEEKQMRK